ncbi:type IV toxin-antitoxin system AbiEi family antitoxin domain-containing protein [Microbacterium sp.]|uniref:type IV toxin-antitoxin system AbiEi family antitoxin domain-containing protein n=1 Tax=Microbacterium sp. TaxID=51671 RepID=UPI0028AC38E8|nr:type IV toxin-antitoxin system AbiEi family antitoxin domain-containing protein [Microbacterium sp.]
MPKPRPLPAQLGAIFSVREAAQAGVAPSRLRRGDLERPFRGIRAVTALLSATDADTEAEADDEADAEVPPATAEPDPFTLQAEARRDLVRRYAPRLEGSQFISHESAAAMWHAPLPLTWTDAGAPASSSDLTVHVSTFGRGHLIRAEGVSAHRARHRTSRYTHVERIPVADPATTWASLGHLPLVDLVALGDYFCRVWRAGYGRPRAGTPPLSTVARLQAAIDAGRRTGIRRLREAVELIREDSWSPRESAVRCHLVFAGLPEPVLNQDVYDEHGRFVACADLAYPERKVAIEYQGVLHANSYAADVERLARLRAAGWVVIEVTATLLADPRMLVERVSAALRARP